MPHQLGSRPLSTRDCPDCGAEDGMRLQNVARTPPTNIPLLYVCERCRTMLTIPPQECPVPEPMKLRGIDTKM